MKTPFALLAACLSVSFICAPPAPNAVRDGELDAAQAAFDVLHYGLELEVEPETRSIRGALTVRARMLERVDQLVLDLDAALKVSGVRSGEVRLSHTQKDNRIFIELGPLGDAEEIEVTVAYAGRPRVAPRPPWDGGFTWAETPSGEPWIATSCQGEGADVWWPCKDHPSDEPDSMDLRITVPKGLVVATNGKRMEVQTKGNKTISRWHVSTPVNNYGIALNIAPYVELTTDYRSVAGVMIPVTFWVLPEHEEEGEAILPEFLEHLRFFEELLGPYPFRADKYGIAETPHLGMEHQTIIAYGNKFREDERWGFDWLHHHELAHEWWGNLATVPDWRDFWIHEGFATYAQALYAEKLHGIDGYHEYMRRFRQFNNRKPVAPRRTLSADGAYFGASAQSTDNDVYYKGAWVLHTLRGLVGDDAFFEAHRRLAYPNPELERTDDGSACHFVTTEDFIALASEEHGSDLGWFFDVYLRQPALPRLLVEERRGGVDLAWRTPSDLPFPMPVEVNVNGTLRKVDVGTDPVFVASATAGDVDPRTWVLRAE